MTAYLWLRQYVSREVSDGSFKDSYGTAAWIIKGSGGDNPLCPGLENDHSSYRSKLAGIYAIITVVNHLCSYYKIKEGVITLGCDGDSALQKSFSSLLDMDDTDRDMIAAIHAAVDRLPVKGTKHYIKGHQDKEAKALDKWAEIHVAMDSKAKQFLKVATVLPRYQLILGEPWPL
jgi:hypothetical protein